MTARTSEEWWSTSRSMASVELWSATAVAELRCAVKDLPKAMQKLKKNFDKRRRAQQRELFLRALSRGQTSLSFNRRGRARSFAGL